MRKLFQFIMISWIIILMLSCSENSKTSNKSNSAPNQNDSIPSVKIGAQIWMVKNLNVNTFRNGDPIAEIKSDSEWEQAGHEGKPGWCYYSNNIANNAKYGKLYNWFAVNDKRGLAPIGWHEPTDREWTVMTKTLGGEKEAGNKMKNTNNWVGATNSSGFTGLPAGYRALVGEFDALGSEGSFWTSSSIDTINAIYRSLVSDNIAVKRFVAPKGCGFSVRCIKN